MTNPILTRACGPKIAAVPPNPFSTLQDALKWSCAAVPPNPFSTLQDALK